MTNGFDLDRFVQAQEPVVAQVCRELREGQKRSHWMWFVFPQLAGLGHSAMARHYALSSLAEAQAYLDHPLLGPRLIGLTKLVNRIADRSIQMIFGNPDDLKFHSSMTLFAMAPGEPQSAPSGFLRAGSLAWTAKAPPNPCCARVELHSRLICSEAREPFPRDHVVLQRAAMLSQRNQAENRNGIS